MDVTPRSGSGPLQGERRTVTILFADVVGSTSLAESLDPEEWAEILAGMHAKVSQSVTRYGGLVAQLLGDGALAFFGAPHAHEDDPERAVYAALDLLSAIKEYEAELRRTGIVRQFQMRVGLNTGLVVVGNVGAGSHVEYLAVGDSVNLAARMQSGAAPGTVLLAESTARAVRHAFDLESLGTMEVKGKAEPVPVHRVKAPKVHVESKRGIVGLDSPLVGRDTEIAVLHHKLDALAAGQGHILAVVGEAGLGKSRLVAEVVQRSPQPFTRGEGRSVSYAAATPYAPIIELLTKLLDLQAGDDIEARLARLRSELPAGDVPFIATLLGLPLGGDELDAVRFLSASDPAALRARVMASICSAFEHLSHARPLALILEDLHWADSSTLDVLERLMPVTTRAPLLLVAVFRPGAHEPSWRFHENAARDYAEHYTVVQLEPLNEASSRTLVANLLHIEDLPESVRKLILAKAEGNPFYVEEVIRSLLDAGLVVRHEDHWRATREIVDIALPDTLAGVITARLDRLDAGAKAIVQTAAVLGRDFAQDLFAQVAEPVDSLPRAMQILVERELILPKSAGDYHFKHVLTQEAAYSSLLLSRRRTLHRRAADALIGMGASQPSVIATHLVSAREPLAALPFLVEAGEYALAAYSLPEALLLLTQAVEIASSTDDMALARRAFEGLGNARTLTFDPPAALEVYGAMEQYAIGHGDFPMHVSALNKLGYVQSMLLGQFDQASAYLNRAEDLARGCDDRAGLAEGLVNRCMIGTANADFDQVVGHLSTLVEVGRELRRDFETALGLVHAANAWTYLTRFDMAWPAAQEAQAFAEEHGDLLHLAHSLAFPAPFCHLSFGDTAGAQEAAQRATEISTRIGDNMGLFDATYVLGEITRWQGDYAAALAHFQGSLHAAQQLGFPFYIAMALGALCGATMEMDPAKFDETLEMHEQALQLLNHPLGLMAGGNVWADLGECALILGRIDMARQMFEKGLATRTVFIYLHRPRFLVGMARVSLAVSETQAAQQWLREARTFAQDRNMRWCYPHVSLAEAEVSAVVAGSEVALDCFRAAEAQAAAMGMWGVAEKARRGASRLAP